jgi:hypothetical protein
MEMGGQINPSHFTLEGELVPAVDEASVTQELSIKMWKKRKYLPPVLFVHPFPCT